MIVTPITAYESQIWASVCIGKTLYSKSICHRHPYEKSILSCALFLWRLNMLQMLWCSATSEGTLSLWNYWHMGLLPDTWNCGLRMRRECQERFPRYSGLATPTCITTPASRTCRDACRDRLLAVFFEVSGGENVPGIPGACAIRNFTYLARGP